MKELRRKYRMFLMRNKNKGIPRLMLWICLFNAIVYVYSLFVRDFDVVELLCFDAEAIMQGQVWRLFTYIFTFASQTSFIFGIPIIGAVISILFYNWIGNILEVYWGRLQFNIYYLTGILLMDLFGMIFFWVFRQDPYVSVHDLNLSLFLAVATIIPEQKILLYFFIPVKMKWMGLVYIGIMLYGVIRTIVLNALLLISGNAAIIAYLFFYALFPFVALLNYFLFFGKNFLVLLPNAWTRHRSKVSKAYVKSDRNYQASPSAAQAPKKAVVNYRHKCTICGRTDVSNPDLEFRYCSKCRGYYCYCMDHINNHTHIE